MLSIENVDKLKYIYSSNELEEYKSQIELYDKITLEREEVYEKCHPRYNRFDSKDLFLDLLMLFDKNLESKNVLDLGCGGSNLTLSLYFPSFAEPLSFMGCNVYGIDLKQNKCNPKYKHFAKDLRFFNSITAKKLEIPENLDLIIIKSLLNSGILYDTSMNESVWREDGPEREWNIYKNLILESSKHNKNKNALYLLELPRKENLGIEYDNNIDSDVLPQSNYKEIFDNLGKEILFTRSSHVWCVNKE